MQTLAYKLQILTITCESTASLLEGRMQWFNCCSFYAFVVQRLKISEHCNTCSLELFEPLLPRAIIKFHRILVNQLKHSFEKSQMSVSEHEKLATTRD